MDENKFDYEAFLEKAAGYRYEMRKERQVKQKIMKALSNIGAAAFKLCRHLETEFHESEDGEKSKQLVSADLIDDAVFLSAGKRRLTFLILYGVGLDSDLPGGRNERCGQIGAYSYLEDHEEARLHSRLYIYGSGDISDGMSDWNLQSGNDAFLPYVARMMEETLFYPDLRWRPTDRMSRPFCAPPVEDGRILIDFLRRSAVSLAAEDENPDLT